MPTTPAKDTCDLPRRWFPALADLADRPGTLLCAVLLLNALALPYAGLAHDARLYAAQLTERLHPGAFADDLYLRYGSQDRFSAFTLIMSPVVLALGLDAAFFLVYLASKALFFWSALRLLRAVLRDRVAVLLSLALLAVAPTPIGGNEIFHLNESFLTPRIAACALVLLALERVLAGGCKTAALCLAGSLALHPLMAPAGVLTVLLWWLAGRLTGRQLAALVVVGLGACGVLAYRPLGERLFGVMDPEWCDVTLEICFFVRPAEWVWSDWARIGWGFLLVGAGAFSFARGFRRFLLAVLVVAAAGLAGTFAAVQAHYQLLIQVSPYRAVWLLEFLASPLACLWMVRLWQRGTAAARSAALGLLLLTTLGWDYEQALTFGFLALLCALVVVACRGLQPRPAREDWLWRGAVLGFGVALAAFALYDLALLGVLFAARPEPNMDIHPVQVLLVAPRILYRLPLLVAAFLVLQRLMARWGTRARLRAGLLGLWLGYQALILWATHSPWYGRNFTATYRHVEFVTAYLREHAPREQGKPTVYWPTDLRAIWFDADATSYFSWVQLSGCGFDRETALEGKRRAQLVRAFETAAARKSPPPEPWWRHASARFFRAGDEEEPPGPPDLFALCDDPLLDFVVLDRPFRGLYSATDGHLYVYDCRSLRALARGQAAPPPAGADLVSSAASGRR
jgi:hypothetical protein